MNSQKVNGEVFYHICTRQQVFQVGEVINSVYQNNPFYEQFFKNDVELWNEKQYLHYYINYYWHFARETIFEEVRRKKFSHLPSRTKCLFLCNESNIDYWSLVLNKERQNRILKLKVYGELFNADTTFIDNILSSNSNCFPSLDYVKACAEDYWSGRIIYSKKQEYLFLGNAIVEEIE